MNVTCPHCRKSIELVGATELRDEYGLGPNMVVNARKRGTFPEPFLSFGNRNLYLRDEVDGFAANRPLRGPVPAPVLAEQVAKLLEEMSKEDRKEFLRRLEPAGSGRSRK